MPLLGMNRCDKSCRNDKCSKATDLYDCGTATFGIVKGNIQSVLTLVIRDPGGGKEG
jgi:hypothetical protein